MKFSIYNFPVFTDDCLILYNTNLEQYVSIEEEEELEKFKTLLDKKNFSCKDDMVRQLYNKGFIVDDDVDEYEKVKEKINNTYKTRSKILSLTIYVTEHCNFRCIYCPQKHKPYTFSAKHWESLYKYISKSIKKDQYEGIMIHFFGGEPLIESKAIITFLTKIKTLLKDYNNIKEYYKMTTNAYLLTPEMYDALSNLGITSYQITLDGFAKTHNKMRKLVNGEGTWDVIVNNLKYINSVQDNVNILLRSNFNDINLPDLTVFYQWLNDTFDNKKIVFDISPIVKFSNNVSDEYLTKMSQDEIHKAIKQYNRLMYNPYDTLMFLNKTCKCANPSYYVLSADGQISKCDQAYDNDFNSVGYLDLEGNFIFNSSIDDYMTNFEMENCKICFLYPLCAARACPRNKIVSTNIRFDCPFNNEDVKKQITDNVIDIFKAGAK